MNSTNRNKRNIIFAFILLIFVLATACGKEETPKAGGGGNESPSEKTKTSTVHNTGSADVLVEYNGLMVAKSEDPFNFCTKYSDQYTYEWSSDNGITIYTGPEGSIPYVLVWRSFGESDAADLLESDRSEMYYQYGNAVISASEISDYSFGGKTLSGIEFEYMVNDTKVTLLRLVDESPQTGYVLYSAKYYGDYKDDTLDALSTAVEYFHSGRNAYDEGVTAEDCIEIVPSISKTIEYETYYDYWFSMDIPSGWTVSWNSYDNTPAALVIHAYDPANPDRQIFTALQTLWFKSEKAYTKLVNYPLLGSAFSGVPYFITGDSPLREFFQNYDVFRNSGYGRSTNLTAMNNWTEIESFGTTPLGGELIRASYTNDSGIEVEGVFSGKWQPGIAMYGYQYPGAMYSPMFYTAPAGEFNEWADILNHCLSTLTYSEDYITEYYAAEKTTMQAFRANTQIYNEMSDMITSSWYSRQTTYDTISAKTSDATLGYDRVYNTETGDVYRAETGFMDSYTGTLYQPITDDMYSAPIEGYIYR